MEKWMRVEEARTYRTKKPRLESVVSLLFGTLPYSVRGSHVSSTPSLWNILRSTSLNITVEWT